MPNRCRRRKILGVNCYGLGTVPPDGVGKLVFTLDKLSLTRGQVFRVYFYENGGSRNFVLTLSGKDVNEAKRL